MLSDFQYCIQLMLKNQTNIKTHPKNFNDKYHDFHCNSSDFVTYIYFPYNSTEMEIGRKHIHVLTADSYEIWQRHFERKIPKGQRSRAEAAEVQVSGSDSGSDDETEQKSRKKRIVLP